MRALVSGGAGFIGSHLVDRLLAEDHHVDVIDDLSTGSLANLAEARSARTGRLTIHQVDVRDAAVPELIERRSPDVVFHLAGPAPEATVGSGADVVGAEVIVVGSLRVLEGARLAGSRKVVAASSAAIYRPAEPSEVPVRESHAHEPADLHGVAKKAMGDCLAVYREQHALEFTALALSSVYGPRQRAGTVARLVAQSQAGEPCTAPEGAPGSADLVFVDDVVDAFVRAAERGSGLVINVGTGVETALADLCAAVASAAGVPDPSRAAGSPSGRSAGAALDYGRARIHLGWSPWTELRSGLEQTVEAARPPA